MYFCTAFLGRGAVMVRIEILSIGLKKKSKKTSKIFGVGEKRFYLCSPFGKEKGF